MTWPARGLLRLLGLLPRTGPVWLARRLAPLWMAFSPGKRGVAHTNLRRCFPGLDEARLEAWLHESFVHYASAVLETGRNWYWPVERLYALCDDVVGESALRQGLDSGRGLIVLAPHFGAWEYLGLFLQRYAGLAILYKPPAHADLERVLVERRQRGGGTLLPATPAGLRRLVEHLRHGRFAGMLPDQEPSAGQGRFAPFFGIPTLTAVLAPRLVQKTGCRIVFAVSRRLAGGRYRVHVLEPDPDIYSQDVDTALAALNHGVERCIAIDPPQYLWSYKRFRTRPAGEPPFYG